MSSNSASDMSDSYKTDATSIADDETRSVTSQPAAPPPTIMEGPHPAELQELLEKVNSSSVASEGTAKGDTFPAEQDAASPEYPEHSNWAEHAEEDVKKALSRLLNLAVDEHKAGPGKSVQEYYSERLAKLLREGLIAFDCSYLH
ncbi:Hypothetical predicted protein [Lecanosticta acicola]|uniref:Uncharacterized protein n=1 Tax=Lecanosticta acicola TaxID=111012 RepID=A0AAI8Z3H8_9PEZI|nr:Hypothetical predicted protein [Lecanosticta acicola]